MSKIINGVASEYDFPFKDFDVRYDEESIQKFNRWQDPTIEDLKKEINKLTAESTEWEERTYHWQDKAEKYQIVLDKILKLKRYTSLMEYDEEFVKLKDILKLLEEIE